MKKHGGKESSDKDQVRTFRKAARDIGCEDNEARFSAALRTVAKPSQKNKKRRPHR